MNFDAQIITGADYYIQHQELIEDLLDQMIEQARRAPDVAGMRFGTLLVGLSTEPTRAATVAALAITRLARADS